MFCVTDIAYCVLCAKNSTVADYFDENVIGRAITFAKSGAPVDVSPTRTPSDHHKILCPILIVCYVMFADPHPRLNHLTSVMGRVVHPRVFAVT